MRTAVTGATGSLGPAVVEALIDGGHEVLVLGRSSGRLRSLRSRFREGVEVAATDYGGDLRERLRGVRSVVHLAGRLSSPGLGLRDAIRDNVSPLAAVLEAAESLGLESVVAASTRLVYDPRRNTVPFAEDQICRPESAYARSKLLGERLGELFADRPRFVAVRLAQVVSPHPHPGSLLAALLEGVRGESALPVFGDGSGARDLVYDRDAGEAVRLLVESSDARGPVNVGGGRAVRALELAQGIAETFDHRAGVELFPDRSADASSWLLDLGRIRRWTGWSPRYDLPGMLRDLAERLVEETPRSPP